MIKEGREDNVAYIRAKSEAGHRARVRPPGNPGGGAFDGLEEEVPLGATAGHGLVAAGRINGGGDRDFRRLAASR